MRYFSGTNLMLAGCDYVAFKFQILHTVNKKVGMYSKMNKTEPFILLNAGYN